MDQRLLRSAVIFFALIGLLMSVTNAHGQIRGGLFEGRIFLFADDPAETAGIDLQSSAGLLVPVADPPGASPFTFFLANTQNQITWGNLGNTVLIDNAWEAAGYTGDLETGDLVGFWGDGPTQRSIDLEVLEFSPDFPGFPDSGENMLVKLNDARAEWELLGIEDYSFDFAYGGCECPFIGASVHVRNGEVSFLTNNISDDFSGNRGDDFVTADNFISIDEMFAWAEREIESSFSVALEFDRNLPIPRRFFFDRNSRTADDELSFEVSNFAIVPEPEFSLPTLFFLSVYLILVLRRR